MDKASSQACPLELWGGLECTVNRVRDVYHTQLDRNGHEERSSDIERFAGLGIKAIRYPVLWERHAPNGLETADWSWSDDRLAALKKVGITPIAGLLHHGSGPLDTSLVDSRFPEKLAEYAGAVAKRYPWLEYYTPVNEPLTTARFSGLYGVWYPHGKDDKTFIQALLMECKGTVLAMREIRKVNPNAKLVQTDDIGKTYGTPELEPFIGFCNERRWLTWDLLCGMVDENHTMWHYLTVISEAKPEDVLWFKDNPCRPDIIGLNYYITSERWVDHRPEMFPEDRHGFADGRKIADIEISRALEQPLAGIGPLIVETYERYGIPVAITEAHIDSNREDQMRWLLEMWNSALYARAQGADVRAVTVWSLLGAFDWNCLVTECRGYYEPGPLDVRSKVPRRTALATLMNELSEGKCVSHPVLRGIGWWRLNHRFWIKEPIVTEQHKHDINYDPIPAPMRPILITGATGTLGKAFALICEHRNISYRLVSRKEMDIADIESVESCFERYKPWAVINCSGYVRVDDAEEDVDRCIRENTIGPCILAAACKKHDAHFTTFSSDLVFDGEDQTPYYECDIPRPQTIYGKSKRMAEKGVIRFNRDALIIRTAAFFGPWDDHNFVTLMLNALERGEKFEAVDDQVISPTYVPDLVNVCLDLVVDREYSIWHVTNHEPVSWYEFAVRVATWAGLDTSLIVPIKSSDCGQTAKRPRYSALTTGQAALTRSLDDAIGRYLASRHQVVVPEKSYMALEMS